MSCRTGQIMLVAQRTAFTALAGVAEKRRCEMCAPAPIRPSAKRFFWRASLRDASPERLIDRRQGLPPSNHAARKFTSIRITTKWPSPNCPPSRACALAPIRPSAKHFSFGGRHSVTLPPTLWSTGGRDCRPPHFLRGCLRRSVLHPEEKPPAFSIHLKQRCPNGRARLWRLPDAPHSAEVLRMRSFNPT